MRVKLSKDVNLDDIQNDFPKYLLKTPPLMFIYVVSSDIGSFTYLPCLLKYKDTGYFSKR